MCAPLVVMGVMAAATAAMQIQQQRVQKQMFENQQEQQRIAVENQIEENRRRATSDYLDQMRMEDIQQQQEHENVAQKITDVNRQAQITVGTARASAAERGVAGRTVDQIAADFEFQASEEAGRIKTNQGRSDAQHIENKRAAGKDFGYRATAVQPYIKQQTASVDYFGPVFQAGAQMVNTGMEINRINNRSSS